MPPAIEPLDTMDPLDLSAWPKVREPSPFPCVLSRHLALGYGWPFRSCSPWVRDIDVSASDTSGVLCYCLLECLQDGTERLVDALQFPENGFYFHRALCLLDPNDGLPSRPEIDPSPGLDRRLIPARRRFAPVPTAQLSGTTVRGWRAKHRYGDPPVTAPFA